MKNQVMLEKRGAWNPLGIPAMVVNKLLKS